MRTIMTPDAPDPIGHYSHGTSHEGVVYVSGQLAIDPKTGQKRIGSIEEQTEQVLQNMAAVVRAGGSQVNLVLKVNIFLSDMELRHKVNEVYARFFGAHKPARAMIPIGTLPAGFLIELDAIAAIPRRASPPPESAGPSLA